MLWNVNLVNWKMTSLLRGETTSMIGDESCGRGQGGQNLPPPVPLSPASRTLISRLSYLFALHLPPPSPEIYYITIQPDVFFLIAFNYTNKGQGELIKGGFLPGHLCHSCILTLYANQTT